MKLIAGHLKIPNHLELDPESKIYKFRQWCHNGTAKFFGEKYRIHLGSTSDPKENMGYIYMLIWILVDDINSNIYLSGPLLPIDLDHYDHPNDQYKFSLFFPMGITTHNENIIVSGGEGDYFSVILTLPKTHILNQKWHTYKNMVQDDFTYKLYFFQNDRLLQIYGIK